MGNDKKPRIEIVLSIQESNMSDVWYEYLCLHQVNKNEWCLDLRRYEVVEAGEFNDSRGRLPSRIKGYKVIRNDQGYVEIDNLIRDYSDYPTYEFSKFDVNKFTDIFFAAKPEVFDEFTPSKLRKAMRNLMKL